MPDIIVHLIDFPKGKKVHEAVTENADGSYSVFIDARLQPDEILSCTHCHLLITVIP